MELNYSIKRLFREFFGVNSPIYWIPGEHRESPVLSFSGLDELPQQYLEVERGPMRRPVPNSWLGTPIVFSATFKAGGYSRYLQNGELETVPMAEMRLPAATIFQFRRAKIVERTNLLGGSGTVKEIYGLDDWIIDVRGICLDEPSTTAAEQFEQLLEWERLVGGIGVTGYLFNQKEIDAVTITEWQDNVVQGKPGAIPFSMQLLSDQAIELVYGTGPNV